MKILFSFLIFISFITSLQAKQNVTLQLAWKNQFQFAGYYMAKEKGFYSNAGLDVSIQEFDNGVNVTDDVINGKADFGIGRSSLINDRHNNKPVVMLAAIFQYSPIVLLTKKRDDITKIEDLKNKKIMLTSDQVAMASINAMLQSHRITPDMYISQEHSFNVQDLIDGKTDVMLSYLSNEPYIMTRQNVKYTVFSPTDYGFDFYSDILFTSQTLLKDSPKLVQDFRAASLKGWKYALEHKEEAIKLILEKYNTQNKTEEALLYEANAIDKLVNEKEVELGYIDSKRIEYITQIYSLMGLIKGHQAIDDLVYKVDKSTIELTNQEKAWIKDHPVVRFTGDPDWLPFEAFNKEGKYIGIVSEYLNKLESLTGVSFEKVPVQKWDKALELSKNREVDVLSETTESSRKGLIFTKPYLTNNIVIVMDKEHNYVEGLDAIKDKKIALIKDYGYIQQIKDKFPYIDFIEVATIRDGLSAVSTGKVDALVCTFALGSYTTTKMGLSNIKIVGKTQFNTSLGLGVREEYATLVSILNKAIDSISEKEHNEIFNHWIKQDYVEKVDYTLLYKFGAGAFILILMFIFWNRKMAKEISKRKKIEHQLQDSSSRMSTLFNASPDSISILDADGSYIDCNEATLKMFGLSSKEEFLQLKPHNLSPELQYNKQASSELATKEISIAFEKGINKFEWQHKRVDTGELFDTEILLSVVHFDNKPHIYGIVRDITETKKAQRDLKEIQDKQKKTIENKVKELTLKQSKQLEIIERSNQLLSGRENKMVELKSEVNEYALQLGIEKPYVIVDEAETNLRVQSQSVIKEINIFNLLDIPKLQHLLEDFHRFMNIPLAIIDLKGNVLVQSKWSRACTDFHRANSESCKRCIESDIDISHKLDEGTEFSVYKCKNGLIDCASPIIIDGQHLANFFIGQFLTEEADIEFFTSQAKFFGYDVDDYLSAIKDAVVVSEEKLPHILGFLKEITEIISTLSNEKLKFQRQEENMRKANIASMNLAEDAQKATKEIEVYKNHLEDLVNERTDELNNQKEFVQTLLDSQEQMIVTTNGKNLLSANKTFFDFYAVDCVTEFMEVYDSKCVCDTFNTKAPEGYLQRKMGSTSWIDYVISRSSREIHKAMITRGDSDFIFSVTAAKLPGDNGVKSVVLTNITEMENAKNEIEAIHKHTRESIEYASLIQGALIPEQDLFRDYFSDFFTMWHPKDIVGGDIYLFEKLRDKDECLLMVIDCTGHGVPGAFVTMLVKALERQIVGKIENDRTIDVSPAWILSYFNRTMKALLHQDSEDSVSNAGFDGGIIYYNKKTNILKYAGAEIALFYMEDEELKTIKGSRQSIGYKKSDASFEFKEHVIPVKEGMQFYCTTDGYLDQNGGEKGFPLGKKRLKSAILDNYTKIMDEGKQVYLDILTEYQGPEERNDDVTFIGFKI